MPALPLTACLTPHHTARGTGLAKGSREFIDIWTDWSVTTWQAQAAVAAAGGWTWNNFNCMLTKEGGFGGSPVDLNACGLAKSEGYRYPRVSHLPAVDVHWGSLRSRRPPTRAIIRPSFSSPS